jgi:DNA-binding NarL/FixJ family response regulator
MFKTERKTKTEQKAKPEQMTKPRFVIADDDELIRMMLPAHLEDAFDCVGAASDAEEAIGLVALHRPDIVILDVDMPAGGAMHATCGIRAIAPDTAIVILSGDETKSGVIALVEAGASAYLRKGVDPESLGDYLKASINAHRRAEAAPKR